MRSIASKKKQNNSSPIAGLSIHQADVLRYLEFNPRLTRHTKRPAGP